MITVCFHGAESTGKSVLAARLAGEFGCPWVPEYGRAYCEEGGTALVLADLIAIAKGQAASEAALLSAGAGALLLRDTDQLMTAAWSQMLFGHVPPVLLGYPKADLYLLFAADVPWVGDGTRLFGDPAPRARFAQIAEQMLVRAGVRWQVIAGDWDARESQARTAIAACLAEGSGR